MKNNLPLIAIVVIALSIQGYSQHAAKVTTLKKVAAIDLPGPPGKRFDYLTIDFDDNYLRHRISPPDCFM
jgi:hypothetical protein